MIEYQEKCKEAAKEVIKLTFFDKIIGRTLEEKIINYCHLDCVKNFEKVNFKQNGRWAFKMIFGFAEICSSFFAFMSMYCCIYFYNKLIIPKIYKTPIKNILKLQYYFCIAAFISSIMFHMRETTITRNLDYLCAFLSLNMGLIAALARVINSHCPSVLKNFYKISIFFVSISFFLHSYKMLFIHWDYVYNKIICGIIFTLACFLDLFIYFKNKNTFFSKYIILYISGLLLAGAIEICDISPVYHIFDSHACWHLLMSISGIFYYEYLSEFILYYSNIKEVQNRY